MSLELATPLLALCAWVATFVVHATLLMAAALVAARRVRSVWLRERLLRVAFFGALCTASLPVTLGYEPLLGRLELAPTHAPPEAAGAQDAGALAPRGSPRPGLAAPEPGTATLLSARASEPLLVREPGPPAATGPTGSRRATPTTWALSALAGWLLWIAHGHGRLALGWLRLRRRLAGRRAIEGVVARDFAGLKRRAGVWAPVRLTVSDAVPVPLALGLVRREICVPRRVLESFTRTEVRAILAHELAHTKRRDAPWFLAYALFERAFPFLPFGRRLHAELLATAELACDDLAVRWTGAHLELASSLTEIARWLVDAPLAPSTIPSMARERSRLGTRVLRLLEPVPAAEGRVRHATLCCASTAALGAVGILAPAIGALAPQPAQETRDASPTGPRVADTGRAPAVSGLPAPVVETAPDAASDMPFGLQLDRELFTGELRLLQDELGALRGELEPLDVPALSAAAQELEHRMEELSVRSERVNRLLERMFADAVPRDVGGAPRADVPAESP